jgi:hypothetical protein
MYGKAELWYDATVQVDKLKITAFLRHGRDRLVEGDPD